MSSIECMTRVVSGGFEIGNLRRAIIGWDKLFDV